MVKIVDELTARLDKAAIASSDFSRRMAEDKSLRQTDNPEGRKDLYMFAKPDQTLEGQASDFIKGVKETLDEALKRYPDSHGGLAWLATACGINAETPSDIQLAWAKQAIEDKTR